MNGKKKFFNFALTLSSPKMKILPLGEMLTLKVDAKNVNCFLTNFVCDLEKIKNSTTLLLPQIFCTDYTWVNIHPILNVFLKTDIHKYLDERFQQFQKEESSEKSVILIDKLHLIKFLLENCRKIAKQNFVAETFVAVFLYLLKCRSKAQIEELWVAVINVFGNPKRIDAYLRKIEQCSSLIRNVDFEIQKEISESAALYEQDFLCKKPIKKSSKFYMHFKDIYDHCKSQMEDEENCDKSNSFYCPELIDFVTENYLPLFPLMSLYFVPNLNITEIPTTSPVENYWKNVKLFFKSIPLQNRYVTVYFTMMLSFFNSHTSEYLTMRKSKALFNKLSNKAKQKDPAVFYPKFDKKSRKRKASDTTYDQEDGFTKRKIKEKSTKFVRRKIDFAVIEDFISKSESYSKEGVNKSIIIEPTVAIADKPRPKHVKSKTMAVKDKIPLIDKLLNLPLKENLQTRRHKRRSCILCRSVDHTRKNCPSGNF
jgi:hypothetical protein